LNKHLVAVDPAFMNFGRLRGRHAQGRTGANVKSGPVTWTGNLVTGVIAIREGSPVMRAHIVDAEELVPDAENQYQLVIDFDQTFLAVSEFVLFE
jgi:hypothetical protein